MYNNDFYRNTKIEYFKIFTLFAQVKLFVCWVLKIKSQKVSLFYNRVLTIAVLLINEKGQTMDFRVGYVMLLNILGKKVAKLNINCYSFSKTI